MIVVKVPDATPGLVTKYALDDEQGLLARLRYNRLIDIFTGLVCYSGVFAYPLKKVHQGSSSSGTIGRCAKCRTMSGRSMGWGLSWPKSSSVKALRPGGAFVHSPR